MVLETLSISSFLFDKDMSLTALLSKPKLVIPLTNPIVETSRLAIPIPVGPIRIAMTLERTKDIRILNTCTPPKREVALMTCLYEL
jgi:hypothetical protein